MPLILTLLTQLARAEDAAPTPPEPPVSAARMARANAERVEALTLTRTTDHPWAVHDGKGATIDLRTWAALTGDTLPLTTAVNRRGAATGWPVRILGITVAGAGLAPALIAYPPSSEGPGSVAWQENTTRNDALTALGFALVGTGVALVAVSLTNAGSADPDAPLYRYRTGAEVDAAISVYNARLRAEFGGPGVGAVN